MLRTTDGEQNADIGQPHDEPRGNCANCVLLQKELGMERELNRELIVENRQLWKENGDLRVELERAKARAAPPATPEDAQNCA
jgi:hypothetical protein